MNRLFSTLIVVLFFAASGFATDFYATPTGSGSTCSQASPCSLKTALANQANMGPSDTLYLCGPDTVNTFVGRFVSTLDGGTVRPCAGKSVIIDGNKTTTLSGAIDGSVETFDVGSTADMPDLIAIDGEHMVVFTIVDSNTVTVLRGWDGTPPESHSNGATVNWAGTIFQLNSQNTTYRGNVFGDFVVRNSSTITRNAGGTTTLNGAINSAVTTITVADAGYMGYGGTQVAFSIDSETMLVSGVPTGNSVPVTRGAYSTTPASHSNGATVNFWSTNGGAIEKIRGYGIASNDGTGNTVIGIIVHDTALGFFMGSSTQNTDISECLTFNNGEYNLAAGQGIYAENLAGYSRIYRDIMVNSFANNGQLYGASGPYVGGDVRGSVFGNPDGAWTAALTGTRDWNLLVGTGSQTSPTFNVQDSYFWTPHNVEGGMALYLGFGTIGTATVNNNYIVGGPSSLVVGDVSTLNGSGNHTYLNIVESNKVQISAGSPPPSGNWNNNTYHKAQGNSQFIVNATITDFAGWKTATGFDAASTQTSVDLPDQSHVIPYSYLPAGTASVVIYAKSNPSSINVNLSTTGLTNGQAYTLKNAFDIFGADVATGTYNSGSPTISVSLTGAIRNVAQPYGYSATTPITTVPEFAVLVVVPGALQAQTVREQMSGGVKLRGMIIK